MTTLIPRLFGDLADLFGPEPARLGSFIRIEDRLTDTEYVLRAEVPGIDPEKDIEVSVLDGVLTVKAERREEETTKNRSEFRYGTMHRSVRLPNNADDKNITARYVDGLLEVTVPLTAPETTGRKIEVSKDT